MESGKMVPMILRAGQQRRYGQTDFGTQWEKERDDLREKH